MATSTTGQYCNSSWNRIMRRLFSRKAAPTAIRTMAGIQRACSQDSRRRLYSLVSMARDYGRDGEESADESVNARRPPANGEKSLQPTAASSKTSTPGGAVPRVLAVAFQLS